MAYLIGLATAETVLQKPVLECNSARLLACMHNIGQFSVKFDH